VFASYQQEVLVARALPEGVPAPRLRWALEREEWLALAFDDVARRTPKCPWQPDELPAVLDMLTPLATALTPAPVAPATEPTSHPSQPMPFCPLASWSRIWSRLQLSVVTTPEANAFDGPALQVAIRWLHVDLFTTSRTNRPHEGQRLTRFAEGRTLATGCSRSRSRGH
jgi:hypothetical protein